MPAHSRNITTADSLDTVILNAEFPNFTSISDLCDCGRHKHHHDYKKQRRGKKDQKCEPSHYQQTFRAYPEAQRQLPLIPPPTPRDPNPPRMVFNTTQRVDFIQREEVKKPQKIAPTEAYEPSKAPLDGKTVYKETYPGHTQFPNIEQLRPPTQSKYRQRSAKFDPRTSHTEQFKPWVSKPAVAFGELPSFAGSILYPGDKLGETQSMTQNDFVGHKGERAELVKAGTNGEIKVRDGAFDHNTVHKMTYKDMGPGHKSRTARPSNQYPSNHRAKFDSQTQNRRDFAGYQSQPLPQKPCTPPPATIRLSMDSRLDFVTEQRQEFAGHDVMHNPKPDLMKKDPSKYQPPTVKFEVNSSHKVDYRPIELKDAFQPPNFRRPHTQSGVRSAKFYDQTTNNRFYRDWGAKPRIRYGDFHEAKIYVPPRGEMVKNSWSSETYKPIKLDEPTPNFKPEAKPMEHSGKQDFTTIHKITYKGQRPKLCKAQLFLLQQEMRRRKALKEKKAGTVAAAGVQSIVRKELAGTV